ncbi:zinc-dependent alcohol dehydrogenase family protein [Bradyrhizobium sp. U87765 SZCCT0131]|uniref:zinc-dependent alcohol dehydrogenase family protein n=1 Tax=unclassified Bradyrhizobium TaxID=2631580 RepID=UPI001BA4C5A4|nr:MULTISPECIES: zinc-dependent alcohol dehydrogenase family protein [unclassified Bradyrhizobium]MBR1220764.1 zinc-dependent alcohol dehydrogenase family protein [Bradyrhizobium sp. U87765 SZCCT0131]MBR1260416.1 zinc-dependent alcohol dehydrogenase family protein [Bradyrhizobium sp. U87765 SZCCT0134]MBR1307335.1 zinc-dependent alcohol dehydrogenase family protein [Bradyrhizobium sp. U87765 SZCCT0110]MBR1321289.1 zinc-dependent alcohol dehydrogenase family protein [Bradyrhizobium sp. U87765 SZC
MARVVRFHEHGGPEVLRIETVAPAAPGPGEVAIGVKALGLNRAEALLRMGTYIETPALPSGLGLEAAGIVEQVGANVTGLAPGDAVSIIPPISMVRWPAYGDRITFPAELVVRHPPSLGWEEAAAVWMAYLTAYGALIDIAGLRRDDVVVITAASSSVGLAAIQIVNSVGAVAVAVTRTGRKAQALRDAGAAHVVATAEEDLEARLVEIAGPAGVRVVLDAIGGSIFTPLTAAMARGGILIEYGGLSPEPTPFPLFAVLGKTLTLRGYLVHEIIGDPTRLAAAKAFILDGLASGALKPVIARTFAFDDIVAAHRYLESNEQFGKIVVRV